MAAALSTRTASAAGARSAVKARAADKPMWFPGTWRACARRTRGNREVEREERRGTSPSTCASTRRSRSPLFSLRASPPMPGAVPPAHLAAADLPGNRGFDPMCLGADPKALAW